MPHATAPMIAPNTHAQNGMKMKASAEVEEPVAVPPQSKSHARWNSATGSVTEPAKAKHPTAAGRRERRPSKSMPKLNAPGSAFQMAKTLKEPWACITSATTSRKGMARIAFIRAIRPTLFIFSCQRLAPPACAERVLYSLFHVFFQVLDIGRAEHIAQLLRCIRLALGLLVVSGVEEENRPVREDRRVVRVRMVCILE